MHSFIIVCISVVVALTTAVDVTLNTNVFSQTDHPSMKLIPKDFQQLAKEVGPESPLLIFIRSGEATHNNNHHIKDLYHRMLSSLDDNSSTSWNRDQRLQIFDPDLSEQGCQQVKNLQGLLESSGWMKFLDDIDGVQYLSSPLTRSIQTALLAIPKAKFTLDDGVRQRMTPLGPDVRRSYDSELTIGSEKAVSVQEKFKHYKNRLVYKMAKLDSDNIVDKFGFYSEEDPNLDAGKLESDEDLDQRITNWINMIHPKHQKQSKVVKIVDKLLPDSIENKLVKQPPKVYVIVANSQFITGVIEHFNLPILQDQDNRPNFCEVIPLMLQFKDNSSTSI